MVGEDLLESVIEGTGLPSDAINRELSELLSRAGIERGEVTLDQLRLIMAEYLQEVLLEAKDQWK